MGEVTVAMWSYGARLWGVGGIFRLGTRGGPWMTGQTGVWVWLRRQQAARAGSRDRRATRCLLRLDHLLQQDPLCGFKLVGL